MRHMFVLLSSSALAVKWFRLQGWLEYCCFSLSLKKRINKTKYVVFYLLLCSLSDYIEQNACTVICNMDTCRT